MANHGKSFGMSDEVSKTIAGKYNPALEAEATAWLETLTGSPKEGEFADWLNDGSVLCKAMNVLKPGSIKKINDSKMAFKKMENIGNFLTAAQAYGLKATDLFQTVDLYEAKNLTQVVDGIHALGRAAQRNKFDGPVIGVKEASEAKRTFSKETQEAGATVIGLQAGFTGGANQGGMSFGNVRKM
eukprot:m.693873 g.693873  ORF g.693873 m.693873 type:complete len:185 (-) comp22876_c0_seq5:2093-2647(-)